MLRACRQVTDWRVSSPAASVGLNVFKMTQLAFPLPGRLSGLRVFATQLQSEGGSLLLLLVLAESAQFLGLTEAVWSCLSSFRFQSQRKLLYNIFPVSFLYCSCGTYEENTF